MGRFEKEQTLDSSKAMEGQKAVRALDGELGIVQQKTVVSVQVNETWQAWGLERCPNHAALEKENQLKWQVDWWKDMQARTYLGIASGGLLSGME